MRASDAKYVLSEVRFIPYFEERITRLKRQIATLDQKIAEATSPVSPNGGEDVVIDGKTVRVKIRGSGTYDSGKTITDLISAQEPLERTLNEFEKRLKVARYYKRQILRSEEAEFAQDFLSGELTYRQIEKKHHVSNAYDKMVRIIRTCDIGMR